MASYRNYTVAEIKARRDAGEPVRLIDVREPDEFALARIEGAELLPLSQINAWWQQLPRDEELVFFCHHGTRSAQVAMALAQQAGFANCANMVGGIEAWSTTIDPSIPQY